MLFPRQMVSFAKHGCAARLSSITGSPFLGSNLKGRGSVRPGVLEPQTQRTQAGALKGSPWKLGGSVRSASDLPGVLGRRAMFMNRDEQLKLQEQAKLNPNRSEAATMVQQRRDEKTSSNLPDHLSPSLPHTAPVSRAVTSAFGSSEGGARALVGTNVEKDSLEDFHAASCSTLAVSGPSLPGLAELAGCSKARLEVRGRGLGSLGHIGQGGRSLKTQSRIFKIGLGWAMDEDLSGALNQEQVLTGCFKSRLPTSFNAKFSVLVQGRFTQPTSAAKLTGRTACSPQRYFSSSARDSSGNVSKTLLIVPWPFTDIDNKTVLDFLNAEVLMRFPNEHKLNHSDLVSVRLLNKEQQWEYSVLQVTFSRQKTCDSILSNRGALKSFNEIRNSGKYTVRLQSGDHKWQYTRELRHLINIRQYWVTKRGFSPKRIDRIPEDCFDQPKIYIEGVGYTCFTLPKKWWGKVGKYTGETVVVDDDETVWTKIVIDGWQPPSGDFNNECAVKQDFANFINEVGFLRSAGKVMSDKEIVSISRKPDKKRKYPIIKVELSSPGIGQAILFNRHESKNLNSTRRGEGLHSITIHRQDRYSKFERDKRYLHGLCNHMVEKKGYRKDQIRAPYDSSAEPTIGIKGKDYTRSKLPKVFCREYEEYWKKEMNKYQGGQ